MFSCDGGVKGGYGSAGVGGVIMLVSVVDVVWLSSECGARVVIMLVVVLLVLVDYSG